MYTLIFLLATVFAFYALVRMQDPQERTLFNPGIMLLGLFSLCYLLPSLATLIGTQLISMDEFSGTAEISQYGACFVLTFALTYRYLGNKVPVLTWTLGGEGLIMSAKRSIIGFLLVFLTVRVILTAYGVGQSDEYADQYLIRRAMPQAVSQLVNFLNSLQWMFVYVTLAAYFGRSKIRGDYSVLIMAAAFGLDMLVTNSRSTFVTFTFVVWAAYVLYRPPIGVWKEALFGVPFVIALGIFSFRRVDGAVSVGVLDLLIPSEFISIYRNALHLTTAVAEQNYAAPPGISYIQPFLSFVPKQIYEGKWSLSEWYVNEYFPGAAEAGGGLAFGIIPEAIVNWGLISICFQAFCVALTFRCAYESARLARSKPDRGSVVLFYLFCFSLSYQVVRSHSFAVVNGLFLGYIAPMVVLREIALYRKRFGQA